MRDAECVSFLQWSLPRMGLRWPGYRKVRGQVCKRIGRRLHHLGVTDLREYRRLLAQNPDEWRILDSLCRITISRFCRDREVFRVLATKVLPRLEQQVRQADGGAIRVWSAGCGAGEEPYSLTILHDEHGARRPSGVALEILATDADGHQIQRALTAVYPASSLRELPSAARRRAFEQIGSDAFRLRSRYRRDVELRRQDLRQEVPEGSFHLILCRNLAFTYFDSELQVKTLSLLKGRLILGGYLVVGGHERLPENDEFLTPSPGCPSILQAESPA